MVFLDRGRSRGPDPWLDWKVRLFAVGAVLGLGGIGLGMDWLVGAGIVVLMLGFVARFLAGNEDGEEGEEQT